MMRNRSQGFYRQNERDDAVGIGFVAFVIMAVILLFVACAVIAHA